MGKWEMVKLGDVITIKNGKNQKSVVSIDGKYPIYGSGGVIGYAIDYLCPENTTIIGRKGSINSPIFVQENFWNVDTAFGLIANVEILEQKFLYYFCEQYNFDRHNKTVTIPSLTKSDLLQVEIPLPPLEEQKRIAKNLDLASELVKLHKTELKELDKLIQSVFYDMFGDPVSNEKGWIQEELKSNISLLNGKAYKQEELLEEGKYPVLRVGNFFSNRSWYYSDLELKDDKYCDNGDLLFAWSASFGPKIWSGGKVIYHYHIWKVIIEKSYNKEFLHSLLDYTTKSFMTNTHGIGIMHLTKSGMQNTKLILPSLPLQQKFADIVTQIEEQKAQVQTALVDAEQLYSSLMQEYFE